MFKDSPKASFSLMHELCKPVGFCVVIANNVTGVLFRNERISLQKVSLAIFNGPSGQQSGFKSQPPKRTPLGICSVGL